MTSTSKSSTIHPFPPIKPDAQRFIWMNRVIRDHSLPHLARLVATLIGLEYLNRTSGDAWPSQARLANDLGASRQGVQAALKALTAAGHLTTEVSRGRGHTNHYRPALNANPSCHFTELKGQPQLAYTPAKMPTGAPENANKTEIKCQPQLAQPYLRHPSKENLLKKAEEEDSANGVCKEERQAANGSKSVHWFDVGSKEDEENWAAIQKSLAASKVAASVKAGPPSSGGPPCPRNPPLTRSPLS